MAGTAVIIETVSRGTRLSLRLYEFASITSAVTHDANRIAKRLSELSIALKQVSASVKDDDTVPSTEAVETIQEVIQQCQDIFGEIESLVPLHKFQEGSNDSTGFPVVLRAWQWDATSKERIEYLLGHLESLKLTLLVMLQAFYAVKVMCWSKRQRTYTTVKAGETVGSEKMQLQALIIEQQMALLKSSELYHEYEQSKVAKSSPQRLLTGGDFQVPAELQGSPVMPSPLALVKYQEPSLTDLDNNSTEAECLSMVRGISMEYIDDVINRWTRLREIEERIRLFELDMKAQRDDEHWERRQKQQPTVESDDSEDELPPLAGNNERLPTIATPTARRPPIIQRTFSDIGTSTVPDSAMNNHQAIPPTPTSPGQRHKPSYNRNHPVSPASSAKSSVHSPRSSFDLHSVPRAAVTATVAAAAAATNLSNKDDSTDLEIPWRLCTRTQFWEHIDAKVVSTNTEAPPSHALKDRTSQTEILASWVCKEAIEKENYVYSQVQKERSHGKKTHLEKCFVIQGALTFAEVERLVERTIDILNGNLNIPETVNIPKAGLKPDHPHLDRSYSSPAAPHPRQQNFTSQSSSKGPYPPVFVSFNQQQFPQLPQHHKQQQQQQPYSRSYSPKFTRQQEQQPPFSPMMSGYPGYPGYLDPASATRSQRPSSRHNSSSTYASGYSCRASYSTPSTSDTDDTARKQRQRKREKQRGRDKTDISGRTVVGTLAKVGGLAALFDGLAEAAVGI